MNHFFPLAALTAGIVAFSTSAQAGFTEFTVTGTSAGESVSSNASFTTSAGQVVLTLQNTTAHTADAGQLLTGIRFTLSPDLVAAATLTSASAIPRDIASNGSYLDGPAQSLLGTWESTLSAGVYQLDFNPNAEFAIVGPADGETSTTAGVYNANGSIKGNAGHNPFTAKSASFTLSGAQITAATTVSNVSFIYNTGLSNVIPGNPVPTPPSAPVPEPSTALFGLALLGASGVVRSRKIAVQQELGAIVR